MGTLQILNIFANALICIGMTGFFILLFGNSTSIVHRWPVLQHWSLKIALITIIVTSAWNAMNVAYRIIVPRNADIINYVQVPVGEVLMNIGLALLFAWIVYFHKYHFMKVAPRKKRKKKSRKLGRAV